jgi:peptide/nickel transport system substrate-binding protein
MGRLTQKCCGFGWVAALTKHTARIVWAATTAFVLLTPHVIAQEYEPPHSQPGPAVDTLFFRSFHVDRAPLELASGNMDLYYFGLRTDAALDLKDDPTIQLYEAPSTTLSLILNPAPAPEGRLNPFSLPEVRRAMQFLVDREFIAQDLYRGLATPMVSHVSPLDYDYLTVYEIDRGSGIRYDPEFGRQLIAQAMGSAGAEFVDERWHYAGQPIRLRFIGRVEDERREISDLIRAELDQAGFEVAISYKNFAPAVLTVYSTDPASFEWHLYTEGWSRGAPQRYDVGTINSMTAPWLGNMPGWQEMGFWQYEMPRLDELGKQLFRGEFSSREERDAIYAEMTSLALDESVRVWLATVTNSFVSTAELQGVTSDVVAGPRSPWTLREAHVPGRQDLTVGHLWVWTERTTWNPIAGFGDVYGVDIWRNLTDPPLWNHPFTGVPGPFRASFEVQTAGPEATLEVPDDAMLWDVGEKRWVAVDPTVRARSKVTFDYSNYLGTNWHHGQPITIADALYSIVQAYELAYDPDKARIEAALAVTSRPYLETLRGYRLSADSRLEVYVDFWHFDESSIAEYASPVSFSTPWEVLAAMDDLVFSQRRAAYSDTAAARFNVPWISLVMKRDAKLVERTLKRFLREAYEPDGVFDFGVRTLVSSQEAEERYRAALAWVDEMDHLVISNGPFWLARYDPPAQFAELRAFRDDSYPFRPGERYLGQPEKIFIDVPVASTLRSGEEGKWKVNVVAPGALELRYLLLDAATNQTIASGSAQHEEDGLFRVLVPAEVVQELFPGLYHLHLAASSSELALIAERRVDVEVLP